MNDPITYRPWIPKAGKADTFAAMKRAYGKPEDWPEDLREVCAERGEALPFRLDPACATNRYYVIDQARLNSAMYLGHTRFQRSWWVPLC